MILLSFCSFPWWLSWLLPFLLGLALGWALWSKYKSIVADLEGEVTSLKGKIDRLNGDIRDRDSQIADLQGDISLAKGKMREAEVALEECMKSKSEASSSGSASAAATAVASFAAGSASATVGDGGNTGLYAGLKNDNLQIIEGIGPKMESVLHENGVKNWDDLSSKNEDELRAILDKYGDKYKIIDVKTWQSQAKYASDGDFDGLIKMQKSIDGGSDQTLSTSDSKLEKLLISSGKIKQYKQDDLKAVEGIGPKIAGLLKDAGINTWRKLSETSVDRINEILEAAGPRYKLADPGTWPQQAGLAADGKWDELRALQDKLNGGR